jgi:hypothetical protein
MPQKALDGFIGPSRSPVQLTTQSAYLVECCPLSGLEGRADAGFVPQSDNLAGQHFGCYGCPMDFSASSCPFGDRREGIQCYVRLNSFFPTHPRGQPSPLAYTGLGGAHVGLAVMVIESFVHIIGGALVRPMWVGTAIALGHTFGLTLPI